MAGDGPMRIVSLSPPITEALWALGGQDLVVGVSDYCSVQDRPRLGSGLTPNYEQIAKVAPTLILTEASQATREDELRRLAPTRLVPWRTLEEAVAGLRTLGELTGRVEAAQRWAARFTNELGGAPPPNAPRVLFVLGYPSRKLEEIWYIRPDSLHGNLLTAAGGINAVQTPPDGPPKLSLEAMIELDPDMIVVLTKDAGPAANFRAALDQLPTLQAVRHRRVGMLQAEWAFGTGPRLLELVPKLRAELRRLKEAS